MLYASELPGHLIICVSCFGLVLMDWVACYRLKIQQHRLRLSLVQNKKATVTHFFTHFCGEGKTV